jgi:hypothetical protein
VRSGGSLAARPTEVFVMAVALAGYITTMVAAFIVVVMAWHHVIGPPEMEKVRQLPHPIGAVTRDDTAPVPATQPGTQPGALGTSTWVPPVMHKADDGSDTASADDAQAAAVKQAAAEAEKAKRQRQARAQKRKEQLARQQQDQQSSTTALGYDQDLSNDQQRSEDFSGPFFNLFGPRRF